jgi:TRAP-type C4-dicarboxylate transport system permease small subunit
MERALEVYRRITQVLSKVIMSLAAVIVGLDVLSIFLEAVGRYVVGSSRAFMEELPRLMVPFVVFPMMGVLLKIKKHISVDILPEKITGKARSLLMIVVYSVVVAVSIQFFMAGILAVKYYHEMGFETQMEIIFKLWVTYLPFPIGFGLLLLFAIEMVWEELVNFLKLCRSRQELEEEGGTS